VNAKDLQREQIEWLNKELGDMCRRVTAIRVRLERRVPEKDDPILKRLTAVNNELFSFCRLTADIVRKKWPEPMLVVLPPRKKR
jgi:hypothetical protein